MTARPNVFGALVAQKPFEVKSKYITHYQRLLKAGKKKKEGRKSLAKVLTHPVLGSGDTWGLNAREVRIMSLLTGNRSRSDIANELNLSEKTITYYITKILAKMGAANANQAESMWIRANFSGSSEAQRKASEEKLIEKLRPYLPSRPLLPEL